MWMLMEIEKDGTRTIIHARPYPSEEEERAKKKIAQLRAKYPSRSFFLIIGTIYPEPLRHDKGRPGNRW